MEKRVNFSIELVTLRPPQRHDLALRIVFGSAERLQGSIPFIKLLHLNNRKRLGHLTLTRAPPTNQWRPRVKEESKV